MNDLQHQLTVRFSELPRLGVSSVFQSPPIWRRVPDFRPTQPIVPINTAAFYA